MLRRRGLAPLLVVAVALVCHWPALGLLEATRFTFDDVPIVAQNPRLDVRDGAGLLRLLTSKYWGEGYAAERLWRPLPLLSYAVDVSLWGRSPDALHRTNLALFALLCLLVLALARRLLGSRSGALAAALLFAAHPVHAECVAGVVGRAEVLALLCVCAGVLLHLRARRGRRALYAPAALCFFAAFLSKESAFAAPALLAVVEFGLRGPPSPRPGLRARARRVLGALAPYLAHAAALGAALGLRALVLGEVFPTRGARTLGDMPLTQRGVVAALSGRDAVRTLLWPSTTSAHYELPFSVAEGPPPWSGPAVLASLALLGGLLALGSVALLRRGRLWRGLGVGVWGAALAFGPVSNLVPIGVVFADRLLFAPSLWACLALACLLRGLARRPPALALALGALLLGYAPRAQANARAWVHPLRLWETSQRRFPQSPRIALALGYALLPSDPARAERNFALAAEGFRPPERWPRFAAKARAGLALCASERDPPRALRLFEEAAHIDAGVPEVALGLSAAYLRLADQTQDEARRRALRQKAERAVRAAVRASPANYDLWVRLGSVLLARQRWREAEAAFARAIERRPAPWQALCGRAAARRLGYAPPHLPDEAGALADYAAAIDLLWPRYAQGRATEEERRYLAEALLLRGTLAGKRGDRALARRCLQRLRAAFPTYRAETVRQLLALFGEAAPEDPATPLSPR